MPEAYDLLKREISKSKRGVKDALAQPEPAPSPPQKSKNRE